MDKETHLQKAAEEQLFQVAVHGSGTVTWSGKEDQSSATSYSTTSIMVLHTQHRAMGEHIHVRCTEEFKRRLNLAAAATDRNLSEYVREELGDAAEEDLDGVVVDDIRVDA